MPNEIQAIYLPSRNISSVKQQRIFLAEAFSEWLADVVGYFISCSEDIALPSKYRCKGQSVRGELQTCIAIFYWKQFFYRNTVCLVGHPSHPWLNILVNTASTGMRIKLHTDASQRLSVPAGKIRITVFSQIRKSGERFPPQPNPVAALTYAPRCQGSIKSQIFNILSFSCVTPMFSRNLSRIRWPSLARSILFDESAKSVGNNGAAFFVVCRRRTCADTRVA